MTRVIYYIDGFNLYNGLKQHSKARAYRWLNLWSFAESQLLEGHSLAAVKFFTATPPWDVDQTERHETYTAALQSVGVEVIRGRFSPGTTKCRICKKDYAIDSEKETDVNIATTMLVDAIGDSFDWAYLITGDADQVGTIRAVRKVASKKCVYVLPPPRRDSADLRAVAHRALDGPLNHRKFKHHLFPASFEHNGRTIQIPKRWLDNGWNTAPPR